MMNAIPRAETAKTESFSAHDLENLIELWRAVLIHEPNREMQQYAVARMRELIAQRSKETVEQMERERGLRSL